MSTMLINKLVIIGVGSIGGSFAAALRKAKAVNIITGVGRNRTQLEFAKQQGVIDDYSLDIPSSIEDADVIMIATPLGAMHGIFEKFKDHLSEKVVVTDAGSSKQQVIRDISDVFSEVPGSFVPGHPIAGTEKSGVSAANPELFNERRVILTPIETTRPEATMLIKTLWQACGAEVIEMQPEHHDEVLAATSHLPHMLAYALVDTLARMDDNREIFDYAAGGFRDFTRIASSDPQMWHDICIANREQLTRVLHAFNQDLQRLTRAIEDADSEFLKETFIRAKTARDKFCE